MLNIWHLRSGMAARTCLSPSATVGGDAAFNGVCHGLLLPLRAYRDLQSSRQIWVHYQHRKRMQGDLKENCRLWKSIV